MSGQDMNSKTVGGTLAFCDWMIDKAYGTTSQVNPWKIALKQVFGTVDGEGFEEIEWSSLDLDEYLQRFQRRAGQEYKTDSITAYGRRVRRAIEAHTHYLDTGKAPTSRPAAPRRPKAEKPAAETPVVSIGSKRPAAEQPGMVTFPYPLDDGRMISITCPPRLTPGDVTRITTFIRTLQDDTPERRQLPSGAEAA